VHLTDDQAHVLGQVVEIVRDCRPDVVLVAGDVYDRAVPPPEAVELLDDVLSRLVLDLKVPTVLIAGNHDSPGRLHFGSRLLAGRRLYVTGTMPRGGACQPLVMEDGNGPVCFYALPYAEPATVRMCLECDGVVDHDSAMRAALDRVRAEHAANHGAARAVLVAHAFVAGGAGCESERPLSVGGAGTVGLDCLAGFQYVALGHLHRPQCMNGGSVRYCGSILKYSFDECDGGKAVTIVEMDGHGACRCESVPLTPRRDVRRVQGLMSDLLGAPDEAQSREDYLEVTLLDPGPVLDAVGRLRDVYPNVLSLQRPAKDAADGSGCAVNRPALRLLDDAVLFKGFYQHVCGDELSPEQERSYATVVEAMHQREREAV
jgi:exonuclease SbcD